MFQESRPMLFQSPNLLYKRVFWETIQNPIYKSIICTTDQEKAQYEALTDKENPSRTMELFKDVSKSLAVEYLKFLIDQKLN